MSEKFKVYTKTGDDGTSGLVGGERVKKYDERLEAYGTIDELNSYIGLIRSCEIDVETYKVLIAIQEKLFTIGSLLATGKNGEKITQKLSVSELDIELLERTIDSFEAKLPELKNFILPGGSQLVSFCHISRTICRRAERKIVFISETGQIPQLLVKYINRLSDFLFVLARKLGNDKHVIETPWISK